MVRPKQFPAGSGRIWLDDVECSGDEAHLGECRMNHWGQHNCAHTEDVGCECHVTTSTEPNGDFVVMSSQPSSRIFSKFIIH